MADAKVVLFSALDRDLEQLVLSKAHPGMNVVSAPLSMDDGEKVKLVADADFLMVWPARLSDAVLRAATKCKLLQVLSAGYDRLNLTLAGELGIPVANNGGANSVAVAEHTVMLILACYRRMLHYATLVKAGGWRPVEDRGVDVFELEGKTVGLIGMGNIAQQVAKRLRAFDTTLQYFDRYRPPMPDQDGALGVRAVSLEELFRTSDVVTIHVPLTPETRGMVGKAELAMMKPTSIIVNTSRGGIIEEVALAEALRSGTIAAAGLDVLEHEPPDPDDPILKLDNAIVTPHNAGPTLESIPKRAANGFANIQRVWNGEPPMWTAHFGNST